MRVRMQEEGLGQEGDVGEGGENRFRSACRECEKLLEFEKGCLGKRLVCSDCGKSFRAVVAGEEDGDGADSSSDSTDEDVGIMAVTGDSREKNGCDGAVRGGDIVYARKRKGRASKVEEINATRKPKSDAGGCYVRGWGIGTEKAERKGKDVSDDEGAERGYGTDDEQDGFWDLKLKDGLSKGKKAEASGGSMMKSKVSVVADEPSKDREKHKVRFRNTLSDVEEKKSVLVVWLRCMADEDRLKIAKSSAEVCSEKHQSSEADMGSGSGKWCVSKQRSTRMQLKSSGEARQLLDEKDDDSGDEVMTLSEMLSGLIQKATSHREKNNYKEKRIEKKNVRENVVAKEAVLEDEKDHKRVEEQRNNDRDVDDDNEYEKDGEEKEMDETREVEERAGWMDEGRNLEIEKMNEKEDQGDQQKDVENLKRKEKEEALAVAMAHKMSVNGNENGEQEADVTGIRSPNQDGTLEPGTWGNGDIVEETSTDARWTKRIRCYETKRRALLKRSKDSRVEILETSGPIDMRSSSAMEGLILAKNRSPNHLNSSNSMFYDFDKDRRERNFKKGQLWAIYDKFGLPRRYGLIDEVLSTNPFSVRLKRLAKQEAKGQDPAGSFAGCGRFKVTTSAVVKSVSVFSHEVDGERVAKEMYDIYPKKGSVWAISDGSKRHEHRDIIVVCLTSYVEMFGLSLAYLEEMGGFRTVYKRKEIGWDAVRWLGKDEIFLLSHQIPARRLSRQDDSHFEEDSWVLDPASFSDRVGKSHQGPRLDRA